MIEDAPEVIRNFLSSWDPQCTVSEIIPLPQDASLRRYFRVYCAGPTLARTFPHARSLMAVVYDSVKPSEVGGGKSVDADIAFVELARFFLKHGVAVPEVLEERSGQPVMLLEDLGDEMLFSSFALESAGQLSEAQVEARYQDAILQLATISRIPPERDFFPYQRNFSAELYLREANMFNEFTLKDRGLSTVSLDAISNMYQTLVSELTALPLVLVHRDFHSWNLMVDSSGKLRVIDFQDALLATSLYDLIALLNDRDTDAALGKARYVRLVNHAKVVLKRGEDFYAEYDRVLLQRDLKVAGLFDKFLVQRGLDRYQQWVPGTVRRIGRTLERLVDSRAGKVYEQALEILSSSVPDVGLGAGDPVRF